MSHGKFDISPGPAPSLSSYMSPPPMRGFNKGGSETGGTNNKRSSGKKSSKKNVATAGISPYARSQQLTPLQQPGGSGAMGARGLRKMSPKSTPSPTTTANEDGNGGGGGMGLTIEINASMESVMSGVFGQYVRDSIEISAGQDERERGGEGSRPALRGPKQSEERNVANAMATPKGEHSKVGAEIDRLIEDASRKAYPLKRLEKLGHGSSSRVFKTIMLDTLEVCAEKVVVVNDSKKRLQVLRELEILRKAVRRETEKYQSIRESVTESIRKSQTLARAEIEKKEEAERLLRSGAEGAEESKVAQKKPEKKKKKKKKKKKRRKRRDDSDGSDGDDEDEDEDEDEDDWDGDDDEELTYFPPDGSQHIVGLLGVIPNPYDGTLSICLEYQDGGTLQDIIRIGRAASEKVVMGIAVQLVAGLEFLHGMRVIHRDLKPSNCLINSAGIVKLADFGLARTLDKGASFAESFMGTMEYMAPERVLGKPYTFASDIWSLGLTIHAVAVGKYPYDGIAAVDETLASLDELKASGSSGSGSSKTGTGGGKAKEAEKDEVIAQRRKKDYWSLLHCINELPVPLPPQAPREGGEKGEYSDMCVDFIAKACEKDPRRRQSAKELLQHSFICRAMAPGAGDTNSKTKRGTAISRSLSGDLLMSASEAADVANSWALFAANALARTADHEELANTHSSLLTPDERALVRKLTKSDVFKSNQTASFMDSLAHNSLSAAKIWALAKEISCDEGILRTAFHAAVGDLRLTAMAAVVKSGNDVDLDRATVAVKINKKALDLKLLALEELSSDDDSSSSEEEEEKKEEEKVDTDDENLMFSDEDCAPLTESEEDSEDEDSEDERRQADMLELGRQMYEAQMTAGAVPGVLPSGTLTLPPAAEVSRR